MQSREAFENLTERERQVLRLLAGGHDAKSVARTLGLSVHTINDRLREARRKTGASSSREAARRLAEIEGGDPHFFVARQLGNAPVEESVAGIVATRGLLLGSRLVWFATGVVLMSLIAAFLLMNALSDARPGASPAATADAVEAQAALRWLALVDAGKREQSWNDASQIVKSSVGAAEFSGAVGAARAPLGAPGKRTVIAATHTTALPGVPAGDYFVFQFRSDFANRHGVIETVTVARESGAWKVAGYFIR